MGSFGAGVLAGKGLFAEMGARPLKRAIDQYVIAPLAATIVERRFPEGDQFVFFRSDGRAIQAEFVDPDTDAGPLQHRPRMEERHSAGAAVDDPGPARNRRRIRRAHGRNRPASSNPLLADWDELKQRLSEQMTNIGFWKSPERYRRLARLALMDRVAAAAGTVEALRMRLDRAAGRRDIIRASWSRGSPCNST